jgi:YD repeat-containing protein
MVGLLHQADGPRTDVSDVTTFAYYSSTDLSDCSGQSDACHRIGDLYTVTDALQKTTTYPRYDRAGRVKRIIDANGSYSDLTYDQFGRLTFRTVRGSTGGSPNPAVDATVQYDYYPTGDLKKTTDPDGFSLTYTYDDAHRLIKVVDNWGDSIDYCPGGPGSATCLDRSGNRLVEQTKDPAGILRRALSRQFDPYAHLIALLNAAGATVQSYANPPEDLQPLLPISTATMEMTTPSTRWTATAQVQNSNTMR